MATAATPNGMQPINLIGGRPYAGATREISIASGYNTAIFQGDAVKLVAAGTIELDAGTDAMTPVGIFMGCTYTDPSLSYKLFNQQWPASTVASDAMAIIVDDPTVLFRVQADAAVPQTALGINFALVQTGGSTAIGTSKNALDASSLTTTNTFPLRLVDFWTGPKSAINDSFTDCIVKWNVGHAYDTIAGT